jgi:hypothetical protein
MTSFDGVAGGTTFYSIQFNSIHATQDIREWKDDVSYFDHACGGGNSDGSGGGVKEESSDNEDDDSIVVSKKRNCVSRRRS